MSPQVKVRPGDVQPASWSRVVHIGRYNPDGSRPDRWLCGRRVGPVIGECEPGETRGRSVCPDCVRLDAMVPPSS